ncbi:mitogen-activated protein kinase kinase [Plasmodiophora brassicae]|nr:hypothetical protein PBRA_002679 [Plasmodiophora brassicae]
MSPPAPSVQQVGFQIEAGTASDRPAGRHNLQLQSFAMAASPRNSFMLTSSTFRAQGFTIGRNGMNAAAPSRMDLDVPVHKKSMFAVTNRMEPLDNLGIIANEETSFSDFELIGDSGRGASSSVLKAVRLDKFGMYALKSMDVHSQEKRHQLVKELTTFASLGRGPNIVKFHGAYYNAGRAMLVLEYMNRGSLMSVVEECGPLPPDVVAHFAKQIFFGLEYIHQRRLVHRDIKPGNILVSRKGRVKLTDFGLAETLRASRSCLTGFIGTQVYMSPERLEGAPYGPAADIWSAGLVVAYAALGRHPYSADEGFFGIIQEISQRPVPDLPAHFPPELRHLVACCLEVDPANRWTANALSQHPALANVRVNDELEWALGATSPADEEDCTAVAKILATKVYNFIETLTMNDIDDEDLLDIAESLGVPVEVIKEKTVKMHRRFTTRRHNGSVQ